MGREIKRVDSHNQCPVGEAWAGYLPPDNSADCKPCLQCDKTGYSPYAKRLYDQWYGYAEFNPADTGSTPLTPETPVVRAFAARNVVRTPSFYGSGEAAIVREALRLCRTWNTQWSHHLDADNVKALVDGGRLWDFTRDRDPKTGWKDKEVPYMPTPEEVNAWHIATRGHDSLNAWICIKARCKRAGVAHSCAYCEGQGEVWSSPEAQAAYEAWERTEPPAGDWWQVWETVSDGSPVTPAFATSAELVAYLVRHGDSADQYRGEGGWKRSAAESFVNQGWAPSLVVKGGECFQPRDGQF